MYCSALAADSARRLSLSSIIFCNYGNHFGLLPPQLLNPEYCILKPAAAEVTCCFRSVGGKSAGYGYGYGYGP